MFLPSLHFYALCLDDNESEEKTFGNHHAESIRNNMITMMFAPGLVINT